jgi:predicted membrane channel-forming protein YqfA (hemolysin III family)
VTTLWSERRTEVTAVRTDAEGSATMTPVEGVRRRDMTRSWEPLMALRRSAPLALLIGGATLFLAACNQVGTNNITFWDIMWSMVALFFWIMLIWIFIAIFADIFRRNDLSGGWKAIWILVIFIIPLFGCLIYIVSRPKATAQDVAMITQSKAAAQAAAGVSKTDQLATLQAMHDSGQLDDAQYAKLKAEIIG